MVKMFGIYVWTIKNHNLKKESVYKMYNFPICIKLHSKLSDILAFDILYLLQCIINW